MEYIISFKSTSHAVKGEQCLIARGINAGVLPVPPRLRSGCGICLRVSAGEIDDAIVALAENGIVEIGLYLRTQGANGYIYQEITDRGE